LALSIVAINSEKIAMLLVKMTISMLTAGIFAIAHFNINVTIGQNDI
jgi:hypothetical protein